MSLVGEPEELIKPPAERMIGSRSSQVPLPHDAIEVACHLEGVGKGLLGERKSEVRCFVLGSGRVEFLYLGFLPNKSAGRCKAFKQWKDFPGSLVIYESKYRVAKALADMENVFGPDRNLCIAREITKFHETFYVGKISDLKTSFAEKSGKGEFVFVVGPEGYVL